METSGPKHPNPGFWDYLRSILQWSLGLPIFFFNSILVILTSLFLKTFQLDPLLRAFTKQVLFFAQISIRVHGKENLDSKKAYVVLFNHTNIFDHFILFDSIDHRKMRGIEKEDHFRWPIYGYFLKRMGQIPIVPKGKTEQAISALQVAKERLIEGVSIGIAPEGTRSPNGRMAPFKKGAFHLAIEAEAEILPVVLVGCYEINQKKDWKIYPGTVDIYFEKPIPTQGMSKADVTALRDRVEALMKDRFYKAYAERARS